MFVKNKKIVKKWYWMVTWTVWLLFPLSLFSQQFGNHTVTIRIVRPNILDIKPSVIVYSSQMEMVQMECQVGKKPKKVTASILPDSFPVVLEVREMGERWTLSPNYEKEILFLGSPFMGNTEWMCKIKAVQTRSSATSPIVLYTMVEM